MSHSPPSAASIRNIGIISHIDAGKTTLSERILFYTGEIHRMGEVHEGEAEMDWMPQEQERGITITATATSCQWKGWWINLIDTPGHVDFTIEVERSLRSLDGAIAVISAVEGVQPQTVTVWRQADRYAVPRVCFINKMDRVGADHEAALAQMAATLGCSPLLLQLPVGTEGGFRGVIDLLTFRMLTFDDDDVGNRVVEGEVPPPLRERAVAARQALLERVADLDDQILELLLAGDDPPPDLIHQAIRRGTLERRIVPVMLGTALRNRGVQPLLDGVGLYLPSPLDRTPPLGFPPEGGDPTPVMPDPSGPVCAFAFKVQADGGRKITWLRVYGGTITPGSSLWNMQRGCFQKVGRLFRMHAHRYEGIETASAGDIVAVAGFRETLTGDTLCSPERKLILEGMKIPEPVVSLAVEPRSSRDRDEFSIALERLTWEDPTVVVREDRETGQTILSGMGELHLEIVIDRLRREFGVDVSSGRPQVVYRETIRNPVSHREIFHHESDGKLLHGEILFTLDPLPRGSGVRVVIDPSVTVMGERVETTLRQMLTAGGVSGYPLVDLSATVLQIPWEPGVTSEQGVLTALGRGFPEALRKGGVLLLEPVMALEITVPAEYAGKVLGGIQQKRGKVEGLTSSGQDDIIRAIVPLAELFGYMTELRSATKGGGSFTMEFRCYEPAPSELQQRLL